MCKAKLVSLLPFRVSGKDDALIISALILGSILALLDSTVLGVAIPTLSEYFSASVQELQKVVTYYTLAAAVAVPLCAWALKRYNSKSVWLSGLFVFLLSSIACSLSDTLTQLTIYRVVQGLGVGVLMSAMQPILLNAVGKQQFKSAMAKVAIPAVIVPILGPLVAGGILELMSWHWIFLLNVPISIGAIALALYCIPNGSGNTQAKLDFIGYFLFAVALGTLVYALSSMSDLNQDLAFSRLLIGLILVSIGCFCIYIFHARRVNQPVLDIVLFKDASFRNTAILLFLSSLVFYAGLFILPSIFVQNAAYSAFLSGVMLGIGGIGALLSRTYLSRLSSLFSTAGIALIGVVLGIFGTLPLLLSSVLDTPLLVALCMFIRGAGLGLVTLLAMTHLYADIVKEKTPDVSSWSRVLTLLGGTIGTALIGWLFQLHVFETFSATIVALVMANTLCLAPAFFLSRRHRAS